MTEKNLNKNECHIIAKEMLTKGGGPAPFYTGQYYPSPFNSKSSSDIINWCAKGLSIISENENISKRTQNIILDIYWSFITGGILVPDVKFGGVVPINSEKGKNFELLRLTEYGERFIQDSLPSPYQIDEFVNEIKKNSIPIFDEVIEIYLIESLKCFKLKLNLASMFLLGDAVEQIFKKIISQFSKKCVESNFQKEFLSKFKKPGIDKHISRFKEIMLKHKNSFHGYLKRHYNDWISTFDEIRIDRNDIGHANIEHFDSGVIYGYYLRLRSVLKELNKLFEHFEKNKINGI